MALGYKLKEILDKKGMTVTEVSKKTGIPASTLYSIINRDSTTIKTDIVMKLIDALDVPIWELIGINKNDILEKFNFDNSFNYLNDESQREERLFYTELLKSEGHTIPISSSDINALYWDIKKIDTSIDERELLDNYRKLNSEGQEEAKKQLKNLTKIKDYIVNEEPYEND